MWIKDFGKKELVHCDILNFAWRMYGIYLYQFMCIYLSFCLYLCFLYIYVCPSKLLSTHLMVYVSIHIIHPPNHTSLLDMFKVKFILQSVHLSIYLSIHPYIWSNIVCLQYKTEVTSHSLWQCFKYCHIYVGEKVKDLWEPPKRQTDYSCR
jgi:hypothetical protein